MRPRGGMKARPLRSLASPAPADAATRVPRPTLRPAPHEVGMRPANAAGRRRYGERILSDLVEVAGMIDAIMPGSVRNAARAVQAWDRWLLGCTFVLLALGVIMVYSASIAYAEREMQNSAYYLIRHVSFAILGLVLMVFVMHTRIRWWEKSGPFLLLLGI